ncbi:MAG: hypothetical protein APF82_04940 [Sphingomonadales bacterium BRH_c42]|nr:MAG: hypothetical protein APF82_04940 [Sphingomonadales bacterium BRH_c42]
MRLAGDGGGDLALDQARAGRWSGDSETGPGRKTTSPPLREGIEGWVHCHFVTPALRLPAKAGAQDKLPSGQAGVQFDFTLRHERKTRAAPIVCGGADFRISL